LKRIVIELKAIQLLPKCQILEHFNGWLLMRTSGNDRIDLRNEESRVNPRPHNNMVLDRGQHLDVFQNNDDVPF